MLYFFECEKKMKLYDKKQIDRNNLLFDTKALWALLIPVMIEQLLTSFMGMADSIMVSRIGSAAISAVSLTDSINVLIIQILAALAAGGTIICSQYIGRHQREEANRAARQVLLSVIAIALTLALLCVFFCKPLLHLIFGRVEADVMNNSEIYFLITASSFPFLALFQAGSAFFRAGGNTRFPMLVSVSGNALNIAGNAILIFVFDMGVAGAAISTFVARVYISLFVILMLRRDRQPIVLKSYHTIRPDWSLIGRILMVGVPAGIENGMFQFGKLAIQSSVSTLGTPSIAAEAMTIILENLNGIAGMGVGIALMTVVGQAIGAGRKEEAKYYILKLTWYAELVVFASCIIIRLVTVPVTHFANMEEESIRQVIFMMNWITLIKPLVWVLAFVPGYGLRAAGDVRFSMILSTITMWGCRVALATFLIRCAGFGPIAVWIGQMSDWCLRAFFFSRRFISGKWLKHHVI
jgi:putative MATE family efflux protein